MSDITMTDADALALAMGFRKLSTLVGDFLYANWANIAPAQREKLQRLENAMLNAATDLTSLAVDIIIDEGKLSLDELKQAIGDAEHALQQLDDVRKTMDIMASLIGLPSAIPTGDIGDIHAAYKQFRTLVKPRAKLPAPPVAPPRLAARPHKPK